MGLTETKNLIPKKKKNGNLFLGGGGGGGKIGVGGAWRKATIGISPSSHGKQKWKEKILSAYLLHTVKYWKLLFEKYIRVKKKDKV